MKTTLTIAAVAFGLFRPVLLFVDFNPHIEAWYEAFAHLFVGGLLGLWWCNRQSWLIRTFWILTAVEVVCAAIGIAMKRGLL